MQICKYCEKRNVPIERFEAGYEHCTDDLCLRIFHNEWRSGMALVLVPKSGFQIIPRSEVLLQSGKSSGR